MTRAKNKMIAIIALLGSMTSFAAGCYYYDRDDHWRDSRYRDGRYAYRDDHYRDDRYYDRRYSRYDWERDRDWRYRRERSSSSDPLRNHYND